MFRIHVLAAVAAFSTLAALPPAAHAQPDPSLAEVPVPRLRTMVVQCDPDLPARQAQTAAAAFCAAAADELRRRAFEGDRERLLAWWRQARAAQRTAPAAARPAPPVTQPVGSATPAQLKATYLQCNRLAETTLLDFGTAVHCSLAYEGLKQRVFGGDFQRLLAWSRQQGAASQPAAVAGAGAAADADATR